MASNPNEPPIYIPIRRLMPNARRYDDQDWIVAAVYYSTTLLIAVASFIAFNILSALIMCMPPIVSQPFILIMLFVKVLYFMYFLHFIGWYSFMYKYVVNMANHLFIKFKTTPVYGFFVTRL